MAGNTHTNGSRSRRFGLCGSAGFFLASLILAGCASAPPPPLPRRAAEIDHEERGEIVSVEDTTLDLSNPANRGASVRSPGVPIGPIVMSVPIRVGGEGKRLVPGEEITVRLKDGTLVHVIQERSNPALGIGERVRVLYEKENPLTGESKTRIEREEAR